MLEYRVPFFDSGFSALSRCIYPHNQKNIRQAENIVSALAGVFYLIWRDWRYLHFAKTGMLLKVQLNESDNLGHTSGTDILTGCVSFAKMHLNKRT